MNFRFFTIPVQQIEPAQSELNSFCSGHKILSAERQFVADGGNSFWSICITYADAGKADPVAHKNKIDYREVLSEADFAVYARLRTLRKARAEQEGIPAYSVFSNEQLANMVRQRVVGIDALAAIEGVGKARLEKYGAAFIEVLVEALGTG